MKYSRIMTEVCQHVGANAKLRNVCLENPYVVKNLLSLDKNIPHGVQTRCRRRNMKSKQMYDPALAHCRDANLIEAMLDIQVS